MAKKYRVKDKNGKDKVNVVFAPYDMAGRQKYRADDYLKGLTPEQHCNQMIAKRGEGKFEHESATYDHCLLPVYSPYGGGKYLARVISYEYTACEEIELTFKLNGKTVTEKELAKLNGGDNVVITANQEVTWTLLGNNKLEKLVQGKASYSFTMPKTGKFNIKATGKCDPSASKSVAVQAVIPTIQLSEQDIHDIIKVVSTEVDLRVPEEERKRQTRGVIDTILNRIYLAMKQGHNVRWVLNRPKHFSRITGKDSPYGSIEKTPDSEIKPWTAKYTEQYLQERTKTEKSSIGGNYNYFNPHESPPSWGPDVKQQAEKSGLIFGTGIYTHYHGTAKGETKAPELKVVLPKGYQPKWSNK